MHVSRYLYLLQGSKLILFLELAKFPVVELSRKISASFPVEMAADNYEIPLHRENCANFLLGESIDTNKNAEIENTE